MAEIYVPCQYLPSWDDIEGVVFVTLCSGGSSFFRYDHKYFLPLLPMKQFFNKRNIQIHQIRSCPEFFFIGDYRDPATKDMYEHLEGFREHCRDIAEKTAETMLRYKSKDIYFLGIKKSPSCAVSITTVGQSMEESGVVAGQGIFVEELARELDARGLEVKFMDIRFKDINEKTLERAMSEAKPLAVKPISTWQDFS